MDKFKKEVKELSTADLLLILEDQVELYSEEELKILREELSARPENAFAFAAEEQARKDQAEAEEQARKDQAEAEEQARKKQAEAEAAQRAAQERQIQQQKQAFQNRIRLLKAKGYEGYYEYTTLSLVDDDGGGLTTAQVTLLLNDYALDGWKLVSAYTNEMGHNSTSGGFGGFSTGTNSTIDQHILILERFVRI